MLMIFIPVMKIIGVIIKKILILILLIMTIIVIIKDQTV